MADPNLHMNVFTCHTQGQEYTKKDSVMHRELFELHGNTFSISPSSKPLELFTFEVQWVWVGPPFPIRPDRHIKLLLKPRTR